MCLKLPRRRLGETSKAMLARYQKDNTSEKQETPTSHHPITKGKGKQVTEHRYCLIIFLNCERHAALFKVSL
jgi:hypothetical protein